ncbi:peptide/nickel transport system substrate-binding protein [Desulfacinum hydrothermale DSM 13146]|uniref:Peptide/nickel transport system substrate-binding protein n=1 Tax=Desulfacinum hydrothermale DSM 13146 TaxID=1121390 RepID=A0A1W1XPR8_9BACT|nr:ABC transporter substrate-binding protein [Desulfacinum hydrothermale]SMC25959.1 peptide/nickel transport system substrate-binding protein [Desulfacinum hydrothermale DSM 13146]
MRRTRFLAAICVLAALWFSGSARAGTPPDTLVVGVSSDIHLLDPAVSSDNYDWRQIYPCYDRLVKYKVVNGQGSTEVEPMAAESWQVSEDGRVWTFKIRKGIRFDDGTPLDARAVKFSFERVLKIGKGPADNLGAIQTVDVVDDYTVKITLKNPFGPFLQTLATDAASIVNPAVMKNEKGGDLAQGWLAQHTDGSGPFRLKEWIRGERCVLEAKPDYWGGAPRLKRVVIRFMRESSDRRMALERGDIDIAEGILIDQIPALEKNPDLVVRRYPSQLVEYVYLNCQKPPLDNPLVRQALNYAVDYKGIIDYVLQGNGVQMRGPIPKGMWGHKPEVFQYHRNVAKAKELLKKAGVSRLQLTLIYSERRPTWEQIATILQSNFADIGVNLKLQLMANPTLRDKIDRGDFELCLGAWSPDYADPSMFMNFWFDSNNWGLPGNRSFYKNEKVDALIRKALALSDQEARIRLYGDAQDIIMTDAPYIFLYQTQTIVPMRKNVKGYVYNPMLESMYNFESIYKQ